MQKDKGDNERQDDDRRQEDLDHHANQNNPTSDEYQAAQDNRSNQMNPNHHRSK